MNLEFTQLRDPGFDVEHQSFLDRLAVNVGNRPRARRADRPNQAREAAALNPEDHQDPRARATSQAGGAEPLDGILKHANNSARPPRVAKRERRSFIHEHLGELWVGDAKHGPRVLHGGRRRKSYAINLIDCATRYIVGSRICLRARARSPTRAYGRPRAYYVDGGSAYKSNSLAKICADLGIQLIHTLPGDAGPRG